MPTWSYISEINGNRASVKAGTEMELETGNGRQFNVHKTDFNTEVAMVAMSSQLSKYVEVLMRESFEDLKTGLMGKNCCLI